MKDYTHVIMKKSGMAYIRTPVLEAKADAIPAVWDQKLGKAVPWIPGVNAPEESLSPVEDSSEVAGLREEVEKLTKAEIDQLAQAKFGRGIDHGNKAEMVDAFMKMAKEALEA